MEENKQWKQLPFTIELAKKIQSGEITGRIVTAEGERVRIVCFDRKGFKDSILALITIDDSYEIDMFYTSDGKASKQSRFGIHIELPEETPKYKFKVGDKIKVNIPEDELRGYLFLGCYQGKILTIIRTLGPIVAVKGDNLKEQVFLVEWVEPYEEVGEPLTFKPFDKVLCRDEVDEEWQCDLFSHIDKDGYCVTVGHCAWRMCISYEGNEHLVGTTNNPE